jgi:HAE1 family hydrophobic/amphiphilic exporter-1
MSFLSKISLANRSVVALATIAILVLGGFLIPSLKQELFPSISYPSITIISTYAGASPEIVERDVTIPLEQSVHGVKGLQGLTSYSNESSSIIVASFDYGQDLDRATQTLNEQISSIQQTLPQNVTPRVQAFNFSDLPIMSLAVSSDEDTQALATRLKSEVVPVLEGIDGVGSVNVTGIRDRFVQVTFDPQKLQASGMDLTTIQGILQANNITMPAGTTTNDGKTVPIKVGNAITSIADLENLIVGVKGSPSSGSTIGSQGQTADPTQATGIPTPIKLKDVATVKETLTPSASLTRTNGKPSLGISIVKSSDGNTVSISNAVRDQLGNLQKKLGNNASINIISDQAPSVQQSISDLTREGVIGAAFAIVVILIFLFSIRSTLVTAVSIPLSIVIALIGIYLGNYTLNILTLGGLTIAVGRVVDDSIVVLENIYRHLQSGESKQTAIPKAVQEVAGAITASTLTTVAVFLPLAFTGGLVGTMFSSFSVAVTVALVASLLVALTIIPVLAYWFLKSPAPDKITSVDDREKSTWIEHGYVRVVSFVTGRGWQRALTIVLALVILGGTLALSGNLQTNLFGSSGQGTYSISLTMPPSSSLQAADDVAKRVEDSLKTLPDLNTYQVTVNSGSGSSAFAGLTGGGSGAASATFSLTAKDGADAKTFEKNLRERLKSLSDVGGTLTLSAQSGGLSNSSLQVNVQANDDKTLRDAAQKVLDAVKQAPGLADVSSNLSNAAPQIEVTVDPQKALAHGLTAMQVAQTVRGVYSGSSVTKITLNGTLEDVQFWLGNPPTTIQQMRDLLIPAKTGGVKLSEIATVAQSNGPTQITHIDTNRTATINATVTDTNVGAVNSDIQQRLDKLKLPDGATASLGGIATQQSDTFRDLGLAVLIAILLVYCIMVATFRSLLQPVLLLVSIPFAATGSLLLLLITGEPLGATGLIGFLMLVGIVVTNAIVLLDLVRQQREKGLDARAAMIEGGRRRLRPILMTAIATILALMPMALGFGSKGSGGFISRPLALVVIGGLTSSTVLTLVLVPTLYVIVESIRGHAGNKPVEPAKPAETAEAKPALV